MKRYILLFSAALLAFSAFADEYTSPDGVCYQISDVDSRYEATLDSFTPQTEEVNLVIPTVLPADGCNATVVAIAPNAFKDCTALMSVSLPNTLAQLGSDAFTGSNVEALEIPASVTALGSGNGIASSCPRLKRFILPQDSPLTIVLNNECANCSALTEIVLGANVSKISYGAFRGLSSLKSVTCYNSVPASLGSSVFSKTDMSGVTLYVPADAVQDYKDNASWSALFPKIEAIGSEGSSNPLLGYVSLTISDAHSGASITLPAPKDQPFTFSFTLPAGRILTSVYLDGADITARVHADAVELPALTADAVVLVTTSSDPGTNAIVIESTPAFRVVSDNGLVTVTGLERGEALKVVRPDGSLLVRRSAGDDPVVMALPVGEPVIISSGSDSVKIIP